MTQRLSLATVAGVPYPHAPLVDPRDLRVGIVHLGIGAFHRAHQVGYTDEAVAAAGGQWGICGVTQRSRTVVDALAPQDGLYTVLVRDGDDIGARVAAAVREVITPDGVVARIADPAVRVVTLTVTEKGYRHDPATGRLRLDDPDVQADLADPVGVPRTVVGRLVRGLDARRRTDAGPITVMSCDNLTHNGATLAGVVGTFVDHLPDGPALRDWIATSVRFPSSMVDRIVPATTDADRAAARDLVGLDDAGVVATEPFRQWVLEDDFAAARPAWETAGALFTTDVTPYETLKLRTLNAAHSLLAYLGAANDCATIADAVAVPEFEAAAEGLWREVDSTLQAPAGVELADYHRQLLRRFANPALRHATTQVAADGSQKLPPRLLGTIRDVRAAGGEPRFAALGVAAWMRWVRDAPQLDDPLAGPLRAAIAGADTPSGVVDALLRVDAVFDPELAADPVVRDLLVDALATPTGVT